MTTDVPTGVTTVSGTTAVGAGVMVQLASQTVTSATASTRVAGVTIASATETATVVCFAAGTHVLTTRGEIVVEDLCVGDLAVTASGAHRPIRWIGSRLTHCRRRFRPHEAQPVRIATGAFGPTA